MNDTGTAGTLVSTGGMEKSSLDVSEGYKQTELGLLPVEWRVVRLGEVLRPVARQARKVFIKDNQRYCLLSAQLYAKGIAPKGNVLGKDLKTKVWFSVYPGDFLLLKIWARKGSYGFVPKGLENAIVSGDYPIMTLDSNCAHQDFLALYLSQPTVWRKLNFGAKGSTNRQRVGEGEFLSLILIPLPPLPEQREIARVLRAIQRDIELTQEVIAAARELRKSLMHHLFTYGPVPTDRADQVPLKETEIGPVPEHWQVVRLAEVIEKAFGGGTPSTKDPRYWDGPIPWTTTAVIGEDDLYLLRFQRGITEEGLRQSTAQVAPRGSILVGTRVGVGKTVITTFDVAVNQDITVLIPKPGVQPEFIALFLKIPTIQRWFSENKRGTTIKGLPRADLLNLNIPLPPLPEQREIARVLSVVDRKIEAEEGRKRALEELFRSMLHHLMTGKLRVRPDSAETQPGPSERQGLAKTSP